MKSPLSIATLLCLTLVFACDDTFEQPETTDDLGKADSADDTSSPIDQMEASFSFPIECALGAADSDANTFSPGDTFDATSIVLSLGQEVWDGVVYKHLNVSYFSATGEELVAIRDSTYPAMDDNGVVMIWDYVGRDRLQLDLSNVFTFQDGRQLVVGTLHEWPFGNVSAVCQVN